MIKVITFDLDDTLWLLTPVMERAERVLFDWLCQGQPALRKRHSVHSLRARRMETLKARPELAHQITELRRQLLQTILEEVGVPQNKARLQSEKGIEIFLQARHEVELFDQVEEVIADLFERYILGVLTNGNADIYRLPLGRYFTFSYSAEALNSSKPLPTHFEATLNKTGAAPDEIIHVGDHAEHDIVGAQRCGWHTIWLNPDQRRWPGGPPPSVIAQDIREIPAAVQTIENGQR